MVTENPKKLNPQIIRMLHSDDPALVIQAIEGLREGGNAAYLPVLIELLHATGNKDIRKSILNFLSDLKHREAIPILMEAIQNQEYAGELQSIISACWENGLDYSSYLPVFIDLVIEREFIVAFEAYTVITNMTGRISNSVKETECNKIREALRNSDSNKNDLLQDLLDFLPELEKGI